MKTLVCLIAVCLLVGCTETPQETSKRISEDASVIVIDNCQYIFMEKGFKGGNNYSMALTHKGNCTNHIHQYNK